MTALLVQRLAAVGCLVVSAPSTTPGASGVVRSAIDEVDVSEVGMVIALGRSAPEISLLRRAASAHIPAISTWGGLRGLTMALGEGKPRLDVEAEGQISDRVSA
jgi:hypothetical protein